MYLSFLIVSMLNFQPTAIDAIEAWPNGKIYAFSGSYYYRYDIARNAMDPGYPKTIQGYWPGVPYQRIDAVIYWGQNKAYFFSGGTYVRFDLQANRVDPGYPKSTRANWNLPWDQVDAALNYGQNKVYFFNNATATYVRYTIGATSPDPGYPKSSNSWKGYPFPYVDAATAYGNALYFVRGSQFGKADKTTTNPFAGYPKPISFLPDAGYASRPVNTPPPVNNAPPPSYNTPRPSSQAGTNTINGTLAYIATERGGRFYKPWNNLNIELHSANTYFNGRYNQLVQSGYTTQQAMSQCVKEPNLWTRSVATTTKPAQLNSNKYAMSYSWFGFINLKPGYYKVEVPGYPQLRRWVSFPGNNQKVTVALEYP